MTSGAARAVLAGVALLACLPACAPSDGPPPTVAQRDSAGIAIVESFAPAWGDSAHWRVGAAPLLDLAESGAGDAHIFFRVRSVTRLPDGGIAVVNRGSNEIRKFSTDGAFVASVGGYGEGPGEFSNVQQAEQAGDSLLVRDVRRVALFGPDLRHARTLPLLPGAMSLNYLGNGTLVAPTILDHSEEHGLVRDPQTLLVYDLEGVLVDSIGQTPGPEQYVTETLSGSPLFGKSSVLDTHGDRIFLGSSDRMQVEEIDPSGDTIRILRIPGYPLDLTPQQVEAERSFRLNPALPQGVASLPPHIVEALEAMPSPAARPAYAALLVDPTGAVWLRPFRGSSEQDGPERWLVLGSDGRWLGSVEMPLGLVVREIGVDEILGVWTSELDVQHPQVWRLDR